MAAIKKARKPTGIKVTFQELADAIPHMSLRTYKQKEFAKAVLRCAMEYICMTRAGYKLKR